LLVEKNLHRLLKIQCEEGPKCNPEERVGLHRKLINLSLEFVHLTSQYENGNQFDKDEETIKAAATDLSISPSQFGLKQRLVEYRIPPTALLSCSL
jgi:hypothetical protein